MTTRSPHSRSSGFSLIEMLIVIALSAVVMIGLVQVFSGTIGANAVTLRQTRMTQDLRSVMDIMIAELRRAGYWQQAETTGLPAGNPNGVTLLNGATNVSPVSNCIGYRYDPAPPAAAVAFTRSFRLKVTAGVGQIEWNRVAINCADSPNWQAITDGSVINVTAFTITDRSNCTNLTTGSNCNPCSAAFTPWAVGHSLYQVRQFDIAIAAQPLVNNGIGNALTLNDSVRVRNNETGTATVSGVGAVCGSKLPV